MKEKFIICEIKQEDFLTSFSSHSGASSESREMLSDWGNLYDTELEAINELNALDSDDRKGMFVILKVYIG